MYARLPPAPAAGGSTMHQSKTYRSLASPVTTTGRLGFRCLGLIFCLAFCLALASPYAAGAEQKWWKGLDGKKFDTGGGVLSFKIKDGKLKIDWIYALGGGGNIELGEPKFDKPYHMTCEYQDGDLEISFNRNLTRVKLEGTPFNPNASPIFAEGGEKWQLKGKGAKLGDMSLDGSDAWWAHLVGNKYEMGDNSTLEFLNRGGKFAAEWDYIGGYGDRVELSNFVAYEGHALVCDYQHGEMTFRFSPDLGEVEVTGTSHHSQFSPLATDGELSEGKRLALKKKAPKPEPEPEPKAEEPAAKPDEPRPGDEPGGAAGGGGETLAVVGHADAEPPRSAAPPPLPEGWWKQLKGRAYRLDNGQVMKFVMQGSLLTLEWGKLVLSRAGGDAKGRMRLICINCSNLLQAGLVFNRDLESMKADMGRLGIYTGIYAGEASDFNAAGPVSD